MKCLTKLLLALALLAPSLPAKAAVVDGNAGLILNFLETSDGTWAFVRVSARYHIPLMGEVTILNNGVPVKVDPVLTTDQVLVTAFLGPNGKNYSVCAAFDGQTHLGGDNYQPARAKICGLRTPFTPVTVGPQPGLRQPRGGAPGAPVARPLRD